jgi:hypothetical protein
VFVFGRSALAGPFAALGIRGQGRLRRIGHQLQSRAHVFHLSARRNAR